MNINAMMKQARKMQAELEKAEKELHKRKFEVNKQGLSIVMLGNRRLDKVDIDPALIDPDDKEIVEDLFMLAVNEANELIDQAEEAIQPKNTNLPL
ncbi:MULTISPECIES: YbaB/EbfC family nucleoid-associated protein [unclassified Mycoplasma]|uniref:YbaB/EbfC family nucleoid-associated protein n=1 Tax=unclassified Mycoplasma TaxID=2683645 RepID=UPI000FDEAD9E